MTFDFMMNVSMCWLMALCILGCGGVSLLGSYHVWKEEKNIAGKMGSVFLFVLGILCLVITLLCFYMPWHME
jgi:hypothetical protein